jgi:hypothetical protein
MLAILLDEGQDTCRNNAVGLAEVVVDFWLSSAVSLRAAGARSLLCAADLGE